MTADRVREALTAQPFVPFDLHLVDGRRFTIAHTDYLSVPPGPRPRTVLIYTARTDDPGEYRAHWIDLGLVVELTTPSEPAPAPGPGESPEGNGA
jgi:hypothetical protein